MAFTVRDFRDLVELLEQHPEWRAELRRLVLTEELLALPQVVRELVEAQQRTEQRLEQTEQRLERLETTVQALADAMLRLTQQAVVAGERIADEAAELARAMHAWQVLDDQVISPALHIAE
jgi:ferritin-like metal-binding protein YciE